MRLWEQVDSVFYVGKADDRSYSLFGRVEAPSLMSPHDFHEKSRGCNANTRGMAVSSRTQALHLSYDQLCPSLATSNVIYTNRGDLQAYEQNQAGTSPAPRRRPDWPVELVPQTSVVGSADCSAPCTRYRAHAWPRTIRIVR